MLHLYIQGLAFDLCFGQLWSLDGCPRAAFWTWSHTTSHLLMESLCLIPLYPLLEIELPLASQPQSFEKPKPLSENGDISWSWPDPTLDENWRFLDFSVCVLFLCPKSLLIFYFYLFIFLLCWVFVAARGLSLVVASGDYSLLQCTGFSL